LCRFAEIVGREGNSEGAVKRKTRDFFSVHDVDDPTVLHLNGVKQKSSSAKGDQPQKALK